MQSQLSAGAKTKVAAVAAVVMTAVTAWQAATADGFTWWDLLPVVAAAAGIACTDQVDNTITNPTAKSIVHGALSAVAAVAASLAAIVGPEPSGVSLTKLLVACLGTLAVFYVPELGPAVADVEAGAGLSPSPAHVITDAPVVPAAPVVEGQEITDALRQLDQVTPAVTSSGATSDSAAAAVAAELAAPSVYDQLMAEHAASLATAAAAPAPEDVAPSTGPDLPAAPIPAPADPAPATAPMATVAAGSTPAVPASA